MFHGREIFTDYLLPFLWQSGEQEQISEIVLQILTNVGGPLATYTGQETNGHCALPWWASDEDVVPRLVDKFIIKGFEKICLNIVTHNLCLISATSTKQAKYAIQCLNAIVSDENEKMKIFGQILDQIKVC